MPMPQIGQVYDGYVYNGGDPNSQASWAPAAKSDSIYADTLAREQAKNDVAKLEGAGDGAREAFGKMATADQMSSLLPNTPTGTFADVRKTMGKNGLGWLPWVPSKRESENMETFDQLSAGMALDNTSKLKGPMSDKDIAFLQRTVAGIDKSPEANKRAIDAHKWAALRQTNYDAGLKAWTRTLGSPSAANANGLTFDQWWGKWSADNLPPPGVQRPVKAQAAATSQRAAPASATRPVVAAAKAPPKPGTVKGGYRFRGGDPSKPSSWEKI